MRRIKIPQQDFELKMPGGLMCEGGAYLRDTTVFLSPTGIQKQSENFTNLAYLTLCLRCEHRY